MRQTQMYVCILGEFILVDAITLLYKYEVIGMEFTQVFIQMSE